MHAKNMCPSNFKRLYYKVSEDILRDNIYTYTWTRMYYVFCMESDHVKTFLSIDVSPCIFRYIGLLFVV